MIKNCSDALLAIGAAASGDAVAMAAAINTSPATMMIVVLLVKIMYAPKHIGFQTFVRNQDMLKEVSVWCCCECARVVWCFKVVSCLVIFSSVHARTMAVWYHGYVHIAA